MARRTAAPRKRSRKLASGIQKKRRPPKASRCSGLEQLSRRVATARRAFRSTGNLPGRGRASQAKAAARKLGVPI